MAELDVQELLDRATLAADARWPGAVVTDLEPLHGGVSSLTFAARVANADGGSQRVVVKVAPPGLAPVRNRDMLRQARVLHALADVEGVRVPEVLLEDGALPPFFVMSYVDGESYEPMLNRLDAPPPPETVDRRARAAAGMLARLQSVEPAAVGLGDEPVTTLAEEVARWERLFDTCPDELRHDERDLYRLLAERAPDPLAPRILHGDYRLGNMQFAGDELTAIIDWEIWSIGDPRCDLAWLLTYTDPVQRFVEEMDEPNLQAQSGMPSREALVAEYQAIRPGELEGLDWFLALCYFKIASTTAVLAKQNRRRDEPDSGMELAASRLGAVIERGLAHVEGVRT